MVNNIIQINTAIHNELLLRQDLEVDNNGIRWKDLKHGRKLKGWDDGNKQNVIDSKQLNANSPKDAHQYLDFNLSDDLRGTDNKLTFKMR